MRQRVGDLTEVGVARLYSKPWGIEADNEQLRSEYPETRTFYNVVLAMGLSFGPVESVADMSCGSGDLARDLAARSDVQPILGDLGEGYPYQGPLSETTRNLRDVGLFICTETIEHLDDPDADLAVIRQHTQRLLLSTPLDEPRPVADGHLWVWSREDVDKMLDVAGFEPKAFVMLDMTVGWYPHCTFGVWACE